jgi:hypothetical protein
MPGRVRRLLHLQPVWHWTAGLAYHDLHTTAAPLLSPFVAGGERLTVSLFLCNLLIKSILEKIMPAGIGFAFSSCVDSPGGWEMAR